MPPPRRTPSADAHARVAGEEEQQGEHDRGKHDQRAELAVQIRRGALLDGQRDFLHFGGAIRRTQYLLA